MTYGICLPVKTRAMNIDSLNRSAVSATAQEQGSVGYFTAKSTTAGESEVWTFTPPVTGKLGNLWMVWEPEIVVTNAQYRGLDPDIRNFRNEIGDIFSVFQPKKGDLITLSTDAIAGSKASNTNIVATNLASKLTWGSAITNGLNLALIETTYISLGSGAVDTQRVTAYLFEVTHLA
jgi:hypothetical protein